MISTSRWAESRGRLTSWIRSQMRMRSSAVFEAGGLLGEIVSAALRGFGLLMN